MACAHPGECLQDAAVSLAMGDPPGEDKRQEAQASCEEGPSMVRTRRRPLAVALAVLCVASVVALAADTTVAGTIQHVDPNKGHLTLRSEEGKTVQLQAPAALLTSLQAEREVP